MVRSISLFLLMVFVGASAQAGAPSDRDERSAGDASPAKLSDQKRWALATCAVLTERNRGRHDLLGGCERTAFNIMAWKSSLREWWGVSNREDLLNALRSLEQAGHRQRFEKLGAAIAVLTPEQLNALREKYKSNAQASFAIQVVVEHYKRLGKKSILAWDYCRYVSLCGWGYVVGYLSEAEAWERIMPVARALQSTFESWEDLGNDYLIGRQFWSLEETLANGEENRKAYEKLCKDAASPWCKLPWNLDLSHDEETGRTEQIMLPSGADRETVRTYLRRVAEVARASSEPGDSEWLDTYLAPVGRDHLNLLLLNRADEGIGGACLRRIGQAATEEDRALILRWLEMDYGLASVVRLHHWTQEAKAILVNLNPA